MNKITRNLIITIISISIFGILLFMKTLNLPFIDSLYFVITTITTVGYGDYNLMDAGIFLKLFGILLMLIGAASMAIIFSLITTRLIDIQFAHLFGRYKTKMKNHTILIGWNKTSEVTLKELRKISKVCLITDNKDVLNEIKYKNVDIIIGDETDEITLKRANVSTAKNVITCEEDDSKNIMTALLTKKLNPKIKVISSANEVINMKLLKQAGADEVISPDVIGGRLLTSAIFEPKVVDLIHDATYVGKGTNIEQMVAKRSVNVGTVLDKFNVSVLERIYDEKRDYVLSTDETINVGDIVIVFGHIDKIKKFKKWITQKKNK